MIRRSITLAKAVILACALLTMAAGTARAATLVIDNADPAGQGLNDPTPFSAVGGNAAATLGAARMAVFLQAASIWGAQLQSAVPIHVSAQIVPLSCSATSAVLASTGATTVHRDFPGAPLTGTWYPQALANALAGADLDPSSPDIVTEFNSNLGATGCLQGSTFYLGLDAHPGSGQIDMLSVVLHEFTHGLGFQSYTNFTTGAKLGGYDDVFLRNMGEVGISPSPLTAMSDAQRIAAAVSDPELYWSGANVQAGSSTLTAGLISGHVRLYAPATFSAGASVDHFSTAVTPNELMEPFYTGPNRNLTLTTDQLCDIGWSLASASKVPALPGSAHVLLAFVLAFGAWAASRARPRNRQRKIAC